ncbi:hypothetical protein D0Y65_048657 [Glycine soja]|uniref:Uncharacterized protein n=1 Tax=Glycine soja TaxID=3848 RepID=A0A445FTT4_GLYSO|nr:hypothetical protein D0Y65_048657 [Glycine soja]
MRSEKKPWSPLLFDELIKEILSRLPVKPLIQFNFWALADKYSRLFTNSCNPNALVAEMGYWVPSQTSNVIFRGTNGNWEAVLCGRMGSGKT